ncbi:hypothetical protein LIA77_06653 [Sarocladium implicatum]|nr:hypothetical protein LIA77_06653 [Sarocladium implicatum]
MNEKTVAVNATAVAEPASGAPSQDQNDGRAAPMSSSESIVRRRLKPSKKWTGHQIFYVFILDGIGGMALSAGVNFALAYVMYTTQPSPRAPIKLFALPNTLAGDAAVTIIVQCILTWFVELGLLRFDLRNKSVQPISFVPKPTRPLLRWLFYLPKSDGSGNDAGEEGRLLPRTMSWRAIAPEALRGFLLAIAGFLVLWPISVGALTAFGEKLDGSLDYVYDDRYVPQGFKAVLGGLLGLFTTPLMALFWLIRAGWEAEGLEESEMEVAEA